MFNTSTAYVNVSNIMYNIYNNTHQIKKTKDLYVLAVMRLNQ